MGPTELTAGSFRAEFESCDRMRLRFDSTSAALPSFDLPLDRLSLVAQVGCSED